jgi:hypothetical protein
MAMPKIGVEQVVVGGDKFNSEMKKYETALLNASKQSDAFANAQGKLTISENQLSIATRKLEDAQKKLSSNTDPTKQAKLSLEVDRQKVAVDKAKMSVGQYEQKVKSLGAAQDSAAKSTGGLTNSIATMAMGAMAAVSISAIASAVADFAIASTDAAGTVEEMSAKFEVVFGTSAPMAAAAIEEYADTLKRSKYELMGFAANMQDLLVPMGFTREEASKSSIEIVKLATDLGTFNNLPTASVMMDIQSALVGNYETMKKYSVQLNVTKINQELLNMGIVGGKEAATDAQAAQAALNIIYRGSADALGNAVRESTNYTATSIALNEAINDLKVSLGQQLLPAATQTKKALYDLIKANVTYNETIVNSIDAVSRNVVGQSEYNRIMGLLAAKMIDAEEAQTMLNEAMERGERLAGGSAEQHHRLQSQYQSNAAAIAAQTNALETQAKYNVRVKDTQDLLTQANKAGALSDYELELMVLQLNKGILELSDAQKSQYQAAIDAKTAEEELTAALEMQNKAAVDSTLANLGLNESLKGATSAQIAAESIKILQDAMKNAPEMAAAYSAEIEQIQLQSGLASEKSIIQADALALLKTKLDEGTIPARNFSEAYAAIFTAAAGADASAILAPFENAPDVLTDLHDRLANAGADAVNSGLQYSSNVAKGVSDGSGEIVDATQEGIIDPTTEAVSEAPWNTLGNEIIAGGVAAGIITGTGRATAAAGGMADGINAELRRIERNITITIRTVRIDEGAGGSTDSGGSYTQGPGYAGCFVAGTQVSVPGGHKPIENIAVGDWVYSYVDNNMMLTRVIATRIVKRDDTIRLSFDNGTTVQCSPNHRFLTVEDEWVNAENLLYRNVVSEDGARMVTAITQVSDTFEVYNFETDHESHNYFVNDCVVHNLKLAGGADFIVPPGFASDTYGPIYVESGEHVKITPASEMQRERLTNQSIINNNQQQTTNFNLNASIPQSINSMRQSFDMMRLLAA